MGVAGLVTNKLIKHTNKHEQTSFCHVTHISLDR